MTSSDLPETTPTDFSGYGLHSTGGRYDFDTYEIDSSVIGEPLFEAHEREHNGFTRGTIFGWMQLTAIGLYRQTRNPDMGQFKDALLDVSRLTHERGATYCSVKAQHISRHQELITLLPNTYRALYDDVAAIADKAFASSYGQYMYGKVLINHALDAPLHTRLLALRSADQLRDSTIIGEHAPDKRWDLIANTLRQVRVSDFSRRARALTLTNCERAGLAIPDVIDDEEAWSSLPLDESLALESCLYDALRDLIKELCTQVPTVRAEDFDSAQHDVSLALGKLVGITLNMRKDSEAASLLVDMRARILNDQALDMNQIPRLEGRVPADLHSVGTWPRHGISLGVPGPETEWVVSFPTEETMALARVADGDLRRLLEFRARLALIGSPIPSFQAAVQVDGPNQLTDAYNAVTPLFMIPLDEEQLLDLGSDDLYWYMAGDLQEWWRELSKYGEIRILPIVTFATEPPDWLEAVESVEDSLHSLHEFDSYPLNHPAFSVRTSGIDWLLCRVDRFAGNFIRALPSNAMSSLQLLIGTDFRLFQTEERESIVDRSSSLLGLIRRVWPLL
jgi:hypothetical protein